MDFISQNAVLRRLNSILAMRAPAAGASVLSASLGGGETISSNMIFYIESPDFTARQLPDGETLTYTLLESNYANLSDPTSTTTLGVARGAGGVGAAAAMFACRPKLAGGRYMGIKATASERAKVAGVGRVAGKFTPPALLRVQKKPVK